MRPAVWFLSTKNVRSVKMHSQIVEVYGEGALNEGNLRKWCLLFKEGRANVHDEERSGPREKVGNFRGSFI